MEGCYQNGAATLKCIPIFMGNIAMFGLKLAAVAAILYLMFGGIMLITSGGDLNKVAQAKKAITFAIIGLIIIVGSVALVSIVGKSLGVDIPIF